MELSVEISKNVIEEISHIIKYPINIMDRSGKILWSTDLTRIGSIHEAVKVMIAGNASSIIVNETDDYLGSKEGINLSIESEQTIIGAVGLTGPVKDVEPYGLVIKKMIEVMLHHIYLTQRINEQELDRKELVSEWLTTEQVNLDTAFYQRAGFHSLDLNNSKSIVLITDNSDKAYDEFEQRKIAEQNQLRFLEKFTKTNGLSFFIKNDAHWILFSDTNNKDSFRKQFNKLVWEIQAYCSQKLYFGASFVESNGSMPLCYKKALSSLKVSIKSQGRKNYIYEDLDLGLITSLVEPQIKDEFIHKILGPLLLPHHRSLVQLLKIYIEEDASINKVADRLFIHKNTVQYQLKKIAQMTKRDPRKISQLPLFSIALDLLGDDEELEETPFLINRN